MKLEIEKWVDETGVFESVAKKTFEEAILCYKVGAYKSAFIMSYLSFKLTIKQRFLQFDNNSTQSYPTDTWNSIIKKLDNDDKWEETLNQTIRRKEEPIIKFMNRDKMITDYDYWRNIRNSCAHAKGEIIDASTVESFWNYLKSNLAKFYVLGGKEYITKEFLDYFRYFKVHKENKDLDRILNDISILYPGNIEKFFCEIIDNFEKESIDLINTFNSEIWEHIINFKNIDIKNGFLKCIGKSDYLLIKFYSFFPDILIYIIELDRKFIVDRLNDFLHHVARDHYNMNKYFLEILHQVIYLYNENIEINDILENCKNAFQTNQINIMIEYLNEDKLLFLKGKGIFKKIIEISYKWIYELDASSQYEQFDKWENRTDEVILLFTYIKFDIQLLQKLNNKISSLLNSIESRSNVYSSHNGYIAKEMFEKIIENNKDEIKKIIDNSNDNFDNISNILNKN